LKILGEVQGILIDETSCDRSSYVLRKGQDAKSVSEVSLVVAKDSAPISADVPQQLWTRLPSKEDSPVDPPGEGKPAAEESAPTCTCHPESHRAVVLTSGQAFRKGLAR
jgi:hypothetical protein